ncbi:hypothetical protein M3Y97_00658200 [Aphelenchoides bicaudatus]|nr:hypothetical protein M3Y97_00658200 [Aphelenchoides bicaudatus]
MYFFAVVLFVSVSKLTSARIPPIPFYSQRVSPDKPELGLYGTFSVGYPAQLVKAYLYLRPLTYSPAFKTNSRCGNGVSFDRTKSRTFALDQVISDPQSNQQKIVLGRDNINLPGGYRLFSNVNISIQEGGSDCVLGGMSFGRSNENWSLIRDFLRTQQNPTAIFAFSQVGNSEREPISGTLVMADSAADICNNDWTIMPTVPFAELGEDWGFKIDRIDVARFSKIATVKMSVKGITYGLGVPSEVFPSIKRALGVDRNNKISCNTKTPIRFRVNGKLVVVKSDIYADLRNKDRQGRCTSLIYDNGDVYRMPITFQRGKCQMLNYRTGETGFATMKVRNSARRRC